jgi:hypothetical protein
VKVRESMQFYWKPDLISSRDPQDMVIYLRELIKQLNSMYSELAQAINDNRDDHETLETEHDDLETAYADHTSHPPGAP